MFVLEDQALARGFLDAQIFAEQALLVRLLVIALRRLFLRWLIGNGTGSPNLTVRMRIAGAHHGAAVLENLYVVDEVAASEIGELLAPHFDDCDDFFLVHARKGQIVAGEKSIRRGRCLVPAAKQAAGVAECVFLPGRDEAPGNRCRRRRRRNTQDCVRRRHECCPDKDNSLDRKPARGAGMRFRLDLARDVASDAARPGPTRR